MLVHCLYGSIVLSYCSVRTHKHGLVHTNTHTHTSRPEASCQVFKTSFRKNKASKIRARSLVWSVRKGEKKNRSTINKSFYSPRDPTHRIYYLLQPAAFAHFHLTPSFFPFYFSFCHLCPNLRPADMPTFHIMLPPFTSSVTVSPSSLSLLLLLLFLFSPLAAFQGARSVFD